MPFSNIDRKNLYDALGVLAQLEDVLVKLEGMPARPYADAERKKLLTRREKMWFLSSRFYEFIPHAEYRDKMVPPIGNLNILNQKSQMILNLIQIEMASKILLGALYRSQNCAVNPLEYCIRAVGVDFQVLDQQDPEFALIRQYVHNTYYDDNNANLRDRRILTNIVRVKKHSEYEEGIFQNELGNRKLLFHGSKTSSILSILA